jgi:hypothetical protein
MSGRLQRRMQLSPMPPGACVGKGSANKRWLEAQSGAKLAVDFQSSEVVVTAATQVDEPRCRADSSPSRALHSMLQMLCTPRA